jgi:GINS complex subunit 4
MDLDIDDILAGVSHPHQLHPSQFPQAQIDPSTSFSDHQKLVRAWTTERCTSHLQAYPADLLRIIMARVQAQIMKIEDLSNSDPNSTNGTSNQNLNLTLSILQTDLSRTQFLVRSLLRCRLAKITKYAGFYLEQLNTSDTKDGLLGESEIHFLRNHQALLSNFYSGSFLDAFPPHLRRLDDKAGGNSMVEGPDVQEAVFVRCLREYWESDPGADEEGVELRMRIGEVWVARWEDVQDGVKAGTLELL